MNKVTTSVGAASRPLRLKPIVPGGGEVVQEGKLKSVRRAQCHALEFTFYNMGNRNL